VREAQLAIWNALTLGCSLVLTWGVSLGVRALLPRYLGPERFGAYSFADAVATTFFIFCTLGVDTYVQKEIPIRHEHASEFFGGILALRLLLSALLLTLMCVALRLTGRSPEVVLAATLFGVGQVFFIHNATFVAMLNARGTVSGMSVVNVVAKVSWGACILAAVLLELDLWALAGSFVLSEALRSAVLFNLCRRHLALRIAVHRQHMRAALIRCAPFFVTGVALTLFSRFDVMILSYLADPLELGWYSASSQVSHLGLLLVPLISGVCLPMFSRARRRSEEELSVAIRRSLEVILTLAIPVSLALFVGADVWIRMLGGAGFEPAARSLRAIAPIFILTYVAMLSSSCLNLINRAWTVTRVCLIGIVVNATLNVVLIKLLGPRLGAGGSGVGAALAAVITEAIVCAMLLSVIGRRVIDARLLRVVLLTVLVCAGVILIDHLLRPLGPGRLLVDGAAYVGLALLTGAVRLDDVQKLTAQLRSRPSG
jgi:O-antigen/teichoic acid export membrane protein